MDPRQWYDGRTQEYYPYVHFPNSGPIAGGDASALARSTHVHGAHNVGGVLRPPGVDAQAAPEPYGPECGYCGHAVPYVYPTVGTAPYHQGFGGGDAQGLSARDANPQYGVRPVTRGEVLERMPTVSFYQNNNGIHPSQNVTTWKKKKIPKVVQSAYCEVCKINCNSQEVLNSHRQGKKHKKNLEKLKESIEPNPPARAPTKSVQKKETEKVEKDQAEGEKTKKNPPPAAKVDLESKKRRVLDGGAAADAVRVCTLCNVVCNSQVVFSFHIGGHKHLAMLKKEQGAAVS